MISPTWLEVAEGQSGLISTAQLEQGGMSAFGRRRLVEEGVLEHRERGLWGVPGWSDDRHRQLWEALLRAGPAAVAFRRSAAAVWGMDGVRPGAVEVALPAGHQSRTVCAHRMASLLPADLTTHGSMRITTVCRTLADLGDTASPMVVERATEWALRERLTRLAELEVITRRVQTKGARCLAAVLALRPVDCVPTESDAETVFVQLVRRSGYPEPIRQYRVFLAGHRFRLDFAWPALRLAIEIDSAAVHGPDKLPGDLLRQNRIVLDGWMILRFTWGMLGRGRRQVEEDLATAWSLRGGLIPAR